MQTESNNIDKKLKQLENQSLPDVSKMDEHWQDMKKNLSTGDSLPKANPHNKIFRWIIAATLAASFFFVGYKFIFSKSAAPFAYNEQQGVNPVANQDTLPVVKPDPSKVSQASANNKSFVSNPEEIKDTIVLNARSTDGKEVQIKASYVNNKSKKDTIYFEPYANNKPKKDTIYFKSKEEKSKSTPVQLKGKTTDGKDVEILARPANDTANKKPVNNNNKKTLRDFFAALEKESQSFIINNERDTMILGKEGTELHISANSFYPIKNVTIRLQEFYSYEDIITNKLTTTSNGQPLITGGMLNIRAFSGNKELHNTQKEILIKMVTDKLDDSMQLFLPQTNYFQVSSPMSLFENVEYDTAVFTNTINSINWIPAGQSQLVQRTLPFVKVLNLMDDHHTVSYDRYTTASYFIANSCPLSNQEVKAELEKRYGLFYGRIKVRRIWGNRKRVFLSSNTESPVIGDSLFVPFEKALKYKLITKEDSLKYIRSLKFEDSLYYARISKMEKKYNFRITNLGWINCDRFYNDYRPKIEFVVNLGDTASNYCTLLVFDKIKSMMTGCVSGNKIAFTNVPEGETAKIISISIKDGKPVAAMQSVQLSRKVFDGLKFEEITAVEFKEKVGGLDKP